MVVHVAGPHEALVKTTRGRAPQIAIGARLIVVPIWQQVSRLSLHLRKLTVTSTEALSLNRVKVQVTSSCLVKITAWTVDESGKTTIDVPAVRLAAEHFLHKSDTEIDQALAHTLEGHQRAIVGQLTVQELYRDRAAFAKAVTNVAKPDLAGMGISLVSFTVNHLSDEEGYLADLGATPLAAVHAAADSAEATQLARSEAASTRARTGLEVARNEAKERKIASDRVLDLCKIEAQQKLDKVLMERKGRVDLIKGQQMHELLHARQKSRFLETIGNNEVQKAELEKDRLRHELDVNVRADAELYWTRAVAEARRIETEAEAYKHKIIEEAEVERKEMKDDWEVEELEKRVQILNKCTNEAMFVDMALDSMADLARRNLQPLNDTNSEMIFVHRDIPSDSITPQLRVRSEMHSSSRGPQPENEIEPVSREALEDGEIDLRGSIRDMVTSPPGRAVTGFFAARALGSRMFRSRSRRRRSDLQ